MNNKTYIETAREYLSQGRLQDCLDTLLSSIHDKDLSQQVQQLEIRFNSLRRKINSGIIDSEDSSLEENRISNALLMIITNLAKEKNSAPLPNSSNQTTKPFDYKWIVIIFLILGLCGTGGYLILKPDHKEIREVDNTSPITTTQPPPSTTKVITSKADLKITAFQMKPETPTKGEKVYIQAIVKNIGRGDSEAFNIKWWPGENYPQPAYDKDFPSLKSGKQEVFNFQYKGYPSWYSSITSKMIIDSQTNESNKSNNVLKKSYQVKKPTLSTSSKADLKITAFQMKPETPTKGEKVYIQAIVKNIGRGDSKAFNIKWWAGENYPQPAYDENFSSLKPGEQQVFSFQYEGYPSWYTSITSKMIVDTKRQVNESNENNNILKKSYPVKR